MQTECLVRGDTHTVIHIKVRFLHLVNRQVGELAEPAAALDLAAPPEYMLVDRLEVGKRLLLPWQEAMERQHETSAVTLPSLVSSALDEMFYFPGCRQLEPVRKTDLGPIFAVVIRDQEPVAGSIAVNCMPVASGLFKLRVQVENRTDLRQPSTCSRDAALLRTLASTHTILWADGGEFVSLIDPPAELHDAASACQNHGTWPVLVGEPGENDTMLSAPIILYDYPQVAPESPGDLFDGTEIDEILTLRILTLTDREKQAAAALDDRVRALLDRTGALDCDQLLSLHGTVRGSASGTGRRSAMTDWNPFEEKPKLESVEKDGVAIRPGDRVRLWPLGRADILDLALEGKTAVIAAIEQDLEDRTYLAVVLEDDPGRDLGELREIGHRFFFGVEEVEWLERSSGTKLSLLE